MATYQLNAADLLTLLASTVTPTTETNIINALKAAGEYPTGSNTITVDTFAGPPGVVPSVNDETIASGVDLALVTLPTSTVDPTATYPTPTVGGSQPSATYNITSSGGVIVATGDQAVSVNDKPTTGNDTVVSGAGYEYVSQTINGNARVVAGTGDSKLIGGLMSTTQDTLIGGAGNDTLEVSMGDNRLVGGTGFNILYGGSGSDTLVGGGDSSLVAGTGMQRLVGGTMAGSHDTLFGGVGADVLKVTEGNNSLVAGTGANTLRAGSGADTLVGGGDSRLVAGTVGTTMYGSDLGGSDTLVGGPGNDSMVSSRGDDRMVVHDGNDTITAGSGSDTVAAADADGKMLVYGGTGFLRVQDTVGAAATIYGGIGGDKVLLGSDGKAGGTDSLISGDGAMSIMSSQSLTDLTSNSSTATGGLHTLTFKDGQTIVINDANSNVTIHFTGGGTTTV